GAMSVGTLLGLPSARGLFRRAILQSGGASNVKSAGQATEITHQILTALHITPEQTGELSEIPAEALLKAQAEVSEANRNGGIPFEPVIDGVVLPGPVLDSVAAGGTADVSMLAGTTLDEMRLFTAFDPTAGVADEADLLNRCAAIFGTEVRGTAALATYRRTRPAATPSDMWSAIATDQVFRVPAVRLLDQQSRHQEQSWMYLFTWASPAFDGKLGSCHALEIPFVFNTLDAPGASGFTGDTTPEMRTLADTMQNAWIAFARTGDPNHPDLPAWPRYESSRRATMVLGSSCAPAEDLYAELEVWEEVPA
ncbi:MAG: carboxylesterase family protein, partial [Dehalococcoidia bacterium]